MSILQFMVVSLLAMLASGLPADWKKTPASTKPGLVKIFDGNIDLGDFSTPIPIPGGQRIVAKVNGGTLTGKFNANIQAGISVIDLVDNGQAIVNNVRSFGTTTDGQPFLIDESGLGSADDDFARIYRRQLYQPGELLPLHRGYPELRPKDRINNRVSNGGSLKKIWHLLYAATSVQN
ncbi:MAG: hypothetical protein Q9207_004115 [Kuettlingeria erythrocarpa]